MKYLFLLVLIKTSCYAPAKEKSPNETQEYEIQKDSVWIETADGLIFGILYKPLGVAGKRPAVLCLQGGGNVGLDNYLYEAKFFAKNGIVALVCDKAGAGRSKTSKSWRQQSFEDKTKEYYELFNWLAKQSDIDADKVGVHGMSEGGRLALNMAIEYPEKIAFVNSVSGPIESYKKNHLYAIRHHLYARNTDSISVDKTIMIWDAYLDEVASAKISPAIIAKTNALRKLDPSIGLLPNNTTRLPERPLPQDVHFTLENKMDKIICPVLFQFGELDILVNPTKSLALIPEKSNFEIKNYAVTDHSMNLPNGDIQAQFLADKKTWITHILGF